MLGINSPTEEDQNPIPPEERPWRRPREARELGMLFGRKGPTGPGHPHSLLDPSNGFQQETERSKMRDKKPDSARQSLFTRMTLGNSQAGRPPNSGVFDHPDDLPPPPGGRNPLIGPPPAWASAMKAMRFPPPPPGLVKPVEVIEIPPLIPKLNRVSWEAFQECLEEAGTSGFAIDVLVGEPNITMAFEGMSYTPMRARQRGGEPEGGVAVTSDIAATTTTAGQRKPANKTTFRGQAPLPERIRINSESIIRILHTIHGTRSSYTIEPLLMMQPFRALFFYKDEFRKWRARLEAKFGHTSEAKPKPETDTASKQDSAGDENLAVGLENSKAHGEGDVSEPDSKSLHDDEDLDEIDTDPYFSERAALDELNCLMEFIEHDLEDRIAYLASDKCQKVAFSDIWHLFKPGDFVLSKDGKQAYRVINVKYSTHCMRAPSTTREYWDINAGNRAKLEDSPITIQCVYIDFDGEQIGPVLHTVSINRFEGEKNIRWLDIIPLRLAKKDDLVQTLIARGSTFIETCDTQNRGVPMHYSGFTLDTQEEVDSQVVIDFEEAFAANDGGGAKANAKSVSWTPEKLIIEAFAGYLQEEGRLTSVLLKWKPVIGNINPGDEDEDSDTGSDSDSEAPRPQRAQKKCIPECCSNETVHDDTYVEQNRSSEFIQSQFLQHGPSSERVPSLAIAPRSLKEGTEDDACITDDEKMIVSYRVFGFIMRSRKWAKLDLTYLGPMKGDNNFDMLVLPPGHKQMVESLVTQHFLDKESASDESDEMDIVRGKGKGLILLLHGAPGVGKTTTAECVATYFHKPLFQITCGDLGSTADVVESRLETHFALASRWGCILLIDEADVFLEARQTENFDRNSLVAVFLRTLEYYNGILFLTTNRVGTFDEAFTSRIHISLYYPPLSQKSTLRVFRVNLTRIRERFEKKKERGEADLELDEDSITDFVLDYYTQHKEARWNGRQIRNACQTALALAEFEAQKLANPGLEGGRSVMEVAATSKKMIHVRMSDKHFDDVAKAYLAFVRYLREVHGVSAAQQAKNFRLRQDRYGLGESATPNPLASRQRGHAEQKNSGKRRNNTGHAGTGRRPQSRSKPGWQPQRDDYEYAEAGRGLDDDSYEEEDSQGLSDRDSLFRQGGKYEYDDGAEEDDASFGPLDDEQDPENCAEGFDMQPGYEYGYGQRPKVEALAGPAKRLRRGQHMMPAAMNAPARGSHGSKGSGSVSGRPIGSSQRTSQRRRRTSRQRPDAHEDN